MENTQNWDILLELFAALRIPAFCLSAEELSKNRIRFDFGLRGLFLPAFAYPLFCCAAYRMPTRYPLAVLRPVSTALFSAWSSGIPQNGANVPESAAGAARWVWVGPYATAPCTPETLIERAGFYPSAPIQAPLEVFCQTIPLVAQERFSFAAMEALANRVFGGPDCYLDRTLTLDDLPDTTPAERELLEFTPRAPAADTASPAASEKDAPWPPCGCWRIAMRPKTGCWKPSPMGWSTRRWPPGRPGQLPLRAAGQRRCAQHKKLRDHLEHAASQGGGIRRRPSVLSEPHLRFCARH